ncbi:hypothetical protein H5410_002397 [Solanum commersonii]|uniref:ATP-dependent DNA helicase n=1 Tax=Solanum commersonii TaxID=4109 RepID=A0A9J6B1Y5_SOLCO|nr:hypothetical protein H5410_002397 [Solanum commersonii]
MIALAYATNGVAATILPGGRTTHSRFGIPLQADEIAMTNMSKQGGRAKLIRQEKLIIWDEAPMAKRHIIETVDRSFRDIMDSDIPFGGKVMVFGGDFHQVLPVVPKSTCAEMVNTSLVRSYLWPLMEKIQLSTNMRARADTKQMTVQQTQHSNPEETLIREIFPVLQENYRSADYITEHAILASRNELVDNLNEMLIGKFPGATKTYISFDSAEDDTNNYYQEEYLNTLTPNGLPPHSAKRKCPNHAAEKSRPLKWIMQWESLNL